MDVRKRKESKRHRFLIGAMGWGVGGWQLSRSRGCGRRNRGGAGGSWAGRACTDCEHLGGAVQEAVGYSGLGSGRSGVMIKPWFFLVDCVP